MSLSPRLAGFIAAAAVLLVAVVGTWAIARRPTSPPGLASEGEDTVLPSKPASLAAKLPPELKPIGKFYDRGIRAWAEHDWTALASLVSQDAACIVLDLPSGTAVHDGPTFRRELVASPRPTELILSRQIVDLRAAPFGDVAICEPEWQDALVDGKRVTSGCFQIVHRTPAGWRIVFSMPKLARVEGDKLTPEPGTVTEGAEVEQIRAVLRQVVNPQRPEDVPAASQRFSERALVDVALREGHWRIFDRQEVIEEWKKHVASQPGASKPPTVTGVRVIQRDAFAIAEADYSFLLPDGRPGSAQCLHALVKENEGWRIVMNMTSVVHIRSSGAPARPTGKEPSTEPIVPSGPAPEPALPTEEPR